MSESQSKQQAALLGLLQGLADIGFGTDADINGSDAVEEINSLFNDTVNRVLPGSGIQVQVVTSAAKKFWNVFDQEWGDLNMATKLFTTPSWDLPDGGTFVSMAEAKLIAAEPVPVVAPAATRARPRP